MASKNLFEPENSDFAGYNVQRLISISPESGAFQCSLLLVDGFLILLDAGLPPGF